MEPRKKEKRKIDSVEVLSPDPDELLLAQVKRLSEILGREIPLSRPKSVCLSHRAWNKNKVL